MKKFITIILISTIIISTIIIFSINLITFATGEKDTEKLSSQQVDEITKKLLIEDIEHKIKEIKDEIEYEANGKNFN